MDKNKFGQVLLLSTLPTYPKSLDIFELKLFLSIYFLTFVKILLVNNWVEYYQGHL